MRSMLMSPGSLSSYTFYRVRPESQETDYPSHEDDEETRTQPRSIKVINVDREGAREVNYGNLEADVKNKVLTELFVKSAVNYAMKTQDYVAEYMEGNKITELPEGSGVEAALVPQFDMKDAVEDILKYTDRAGLDTTALRRACDAMCIVPKAASDMMQVGRLQGFDGKITAQGKLLLQDTVLVAETSGSSGSSKGNQLKFKERRVFLFEQIILFSERIEKKKGNISNANYVFKNSLKVNNMSMADKMESDPLKFTLKDLTPGSDMKLMIQAPSADTQITWITAIQKILEMQGDFLRGR